MVARAVLLALPGAGEAVSVEDDPGLGLERFAGLGGTGNLQRVEQSCLQPVGQGFGATGMLVGALGFGIGRFVDLEAHLAVERDAHADGALVVPRAVAGRGHARVGIPQVDERRLGHYVHRERVTRGEVRPRRAQARHGRGRSDLDVRADVPAVLDRAAFLGAVGFLRLVVDGDLGEVQGHVLGQAVVAARTAGAQRADDHLFEVDDQVLDLAFTAGLAHRQLDLVDVLAAGAVSHQVGAGLVDVLGDRQVLDVDLARTAAAAQVHVAGLGHAPAPVQHVDFVLVGLVVGLALDVADLDENIYSHDVLGISRRLAVVLADRGARPHLTRVAFDFLDHHFGGRQRVLGLGGLGGVRRVAIDVVEDPVLQPALHLVLFLERADLVANDALQVMGEAAGGEQVRQARGQVGVGGGVRIIVLGRFLQRLRADEGGKVGVLLVQQWHEAVLGQFRLAAVGNGDLGRALHVHATVVGGEGVRRQAFDFTARLHAADARAPAVVLERTVDVHGHGVGGVGPGVLAAVGAVGVFLEGEGLHRVGLGAVGQARQEARHGQADVARVFRFAQRAPAGVFRGGEDLGQVARVAQFLPRAHAHHRRRGGGDERRVHRGADLGHFAEQLDVGRRLVEVVVAHQAAVRLAAELAVFLFVELLEHRALVPGGALELLQGLVQVGLRDVEHADLQLLVALGVVDQVVQATPGAFQFLEVIVVDDLVDLGGELGVDGGDDLLDRADGIVGHQAGLRQGLLGEGAHGALDGFLGPLGLGLELLQQQAGELARVLGGRLRGLAVAQRIVHGRSPQAFGSVSAGFGALARACSRAGSLMALRMMSSAPVLPSIASTLRATAAGLKSSMLSKVMSRLRLPSPVSSLGTLNATRGFMALRRESKLSTSISRNLRSATAGSGSAGLPARSESTPMTKGSWTFFSAPYSSTSYSICTRGARLRAMNFWELSFATLFLLVAVVAFGAAQVLELRQTLGDQVADDGREIGVDQVLRPAQQHRQRARGLVAGVVLEQAFEALQHVVAAVHFAGPRRRAGGGGAGNGLPVVIAAAGGLLFAAARRRRCAFRAVVGQHLLDLAQRLAQRRQIDAAGRADLVIDPALDDVKGVAGQLQRLAALFELLGVGIAQGGGQFLGAQLFAGEVLHTGRMQGGAQGHRAERPGAHQHGVAQQADVGVAGKAGQGIDAYGRVVVVGGVQLRVQVQPVLAEQVADQLEAGGQARQAVQGQVGLDQEVGDAQVLAALQQVGAGLFDGTPLRRFGCLHGIAHHALGAALGIAFQLQEIGVVFEVVAAREVCGNSGEQLRCAFMVYFQIAVKVSYAPRKATVNQLATLGVHWSGAIKVPCR
ncbi:hypothetical protein WR25_01167 [Diploscapter pachys]|uniref:Uncharacterized protein n=1 Tax=Diploscapter pachys TaxID=2018661 RepID=A0A2A2JXS4_9BILA|nr:hypothetical protein WR25_01167 [Diploscapter pachys]